MTMSKLRKLNPTLSRLPIATAGKATTVAGDSISTTRQLTVGMMKAVDVLHMTHAMIIHTRVGRHARTA